MLERESAVRALIWLKDNPESHIAGNLAEDDEGIPMSPLDSNATCFCFLGRYAREAGLDSEWSFDVMSHLDEGLPVTNDEDQRIWEVNDFAIRDGRNPIPALCKFLGVSEDELQA